MIQENTLLYEISQTSMMAVDAWLINEPRIEHKYVVCNSRSSVKSTIRQLRDVASVKADKQWASCLGSGDLTIPCAEKHAENSAIYRGCEMCSLQDCSISSMLTAFSAKHRKFAVGYLMCSLAKLPWMASSEIKRISKSLSALLKV